MKVTVKDRVAIVTGSGQGIGEGIARVLARAGARVVVNDLVPEKVDGVVADFGAAGYEAIGRSSDVSTAEGAESLVGAAIDAWDRVDILVNNVGIARDGWLVKMSEENWDDVLRVNLKSQFLCCRAAAPHMMAFFCNSGGRLRAASAMRMALSPASTRSITMIDASAAANCMVKMSDNHSMVAPSQTTIKTPATSTHFYPTKHTPTTA